jgi:membrane fusion protein (multidrug efflux system)
MTRASVVTFVFLLVASGASACRREKPKPVVQPPTALAADEVVKVARGAILVGPRIAGTLAARQRSTVRAEIGGPLTFVGPELGQPVKKGTPLARIQAKALGDQVTSAARAVRSAAAQLDVARRDVERNQELVKAGAVAARDAERAESAASAAEAQLAQAQAQLAQARSQAGDATVESPMDGVVAARPVHQGDVVTVGTVLYEIIDPSTMRLEASVPTEDLQWLSVGKPVLFDVRGYPGQSFEGTIQSIAPAADATTRQIPIIVDLPNPGGKLVAGLFADGRVAAQEKQALLVPIAAVDTSADQPSVLRVRDGVVERVPVTVGVRDERHEQIEVTAGLGEGDLVLAHPSGTVTPGTRVTLAPAGAGNPGAAAPAPATPPPSPSAKPADEPEPAATGARR